MRRVFLLLLLLSGNHVWALDPVTTAIEQAQALATKKNRVEACAILSRAWQDLPATGKARSRLTDSLNQIAKMFFTDKGQKTFEAGQSSLWESPDLALNQFREALALEDQNTQVLDSIARAQMIKADCDGAATTARAALKVNPVSIDSALLEMRAMVCKQDFEAMRENVKIVPAGRNKWQEAYLQYLLAMDLAQGGSWRKVSEIMSKLIAEEPQFNESFWWLSRAEFALGKNNEASLQKYVSLCKAVTAREKKKFSLEPRLCANQKEAEDELAKAKSAEL